MNKLVKATTIKKLEENAGVKSLWPWDRQRFLGRAPKGQSIKETLISWTSKKLHMLKNEKTKHKCEKIFANHISDKEYVSRYIVS